MKRYIVVFEVDESWVEDGFELTDEKAQAMLAGALPHAYPAEIGAHVVPAQTTLWQDIERLKEDGHLNY